MTYLDNNPVTGRPRKLWRHLWGKVKEPKVVSVLAWTGYMVLAAVGAYAMFTPPATVEGVMGSYAVLVTTFLVAAGSLFGSTGALPGWWQVERLGIAMILAGTSLYLAFTVYLQILGEGNRSFQAGFLYFVIVSLVGRWVRIRGGVFAPGSKASLRAQQLHPHIRADTGPVPTVSDYKP